MSSLAVNYNQLHYFNVIAECGTLSRAAKQLNVSQPTLSGQLKALEEHFEAKLFDRNGGGLRLNANGRKAFEITREMFRLGERLEELFPASHTGPVARLEIGISTSISRSVGVNRFVELFKSPEILVRVRQGDHEFLLHELLASGLDILITDSVPDHRVNRGAEFRKLSSPEFVVVAGGPTAGKLEGAPLTEIHRQPFIHYTTHSSYRFEVDQYFREQRIEPRIVAEADDVYMIREAVAAGIGIGIIPRAIIDESGPDTGLRVLGALDRKFEVYAYYNRVDPSDDVLAALDMLMDSK